MACKNKIEEASEKIDYRIYRVDKHLAGNTKKKSPD